MRKAAARALLLLANLFLYAVFSAAAALAGTAAWNSLVAPRAHLASVPFAVVWLPLLVLMIFGKAVGMDGSQGKE